MQITLSGHYGYGRLLKTAVPSVVTIMFTSVYSIVDGVWVAVDAADCFALILSVSLLLAYRRRYGY